MSDVSSQDVIQSADATVPMTAPLVTASTLASATSISTSMGASPLMSNNHRYHPQAMPPQGMQPIRMVYNGPSSAAHRRKQEILDKFKGNAQYMSVAPVDTITVSLRA